MRYTCPLCGRTFPDSSKFSSHAFTHLAELERRGLVETCFLKDRTPLFAYKGRWFLSLRDLFLTIAEERGVAPPSSPP